jgi:adenylate cyclase class 2
VRKLQKTPTETEVKLRITDLQAILARLTGIGATSRGRVLERNALFDTPHSDFRRSGRLIRVRIETPAPAPARGLPGGRAKAVLTSKAPPPARPSPRRQSSRYKERAERELVLRKPARFLRNLAPLGLRCAFRYEKVRTSFRLRGLHLDLDETSVGIFLELEGKPPAIDRAAKALGFSSKDYLRVTYWDLYAADCHHRGIKPKNMLLPRKNRRESSLFA